MCGQSKTGVSAKYEDRALPKLTSLTDYLDWFAADLEVLQMSPRVNVKIHVTADKDSRNGTSLFMQNLPVARDSEQEKVLSANARPAISSRSSFSKSIELGRPDIDAIVKLASESVSRDGRLLVAASGPSGLLANARVSAQSCMSSQSAGLHLHLEEFGW